MDIILNNKKQIKIIKLVIDSLGKIIFIGILINLFFDNFIFQCQGLEWQRIAAIYLPNFIAIIALIIVILIFLVIYSISFLL